MKNLKRIFCLAISMILILCSGCDDALQKEKELSASFVPDVAGYKLEVKSVLEFEDEKDRQAQGYLSFYKFSIGYNGDYKVSSNWDKESLAMNLESKFNGTEYVGCEQKKIVCPLSQITAWDHFMFRCNSNGWPYHKFVRYILFDGENYFLITHGECENIPMALYILDFENQKILYCDYAEEYYDYFENLNTKYNPFCFKIKKV